MGFNLGFKGLNTDLEAVAVMYVVTTWKRILMLK